MNTRWKGKKRSRLVVLIVAILLGLVVFAFAYPIATSGGAVAAY